MANELSNIVLTCKEYMDCIRLSWTPYNNMENVRYVIVKKKSSIPFRQDDGMLVYDGTDLTVSDFDIRKGVLYYYRLFIYPDSADEFKYISDEKCIVRAISLKDMLNYGDYLYKNTPMDVRYQDSKRSKDPEKNYPLKRFFQTIAYAFNRINVYDDLLLEQLDIDNCDEHYIKYHAKWMHELYDERFGADISRLILKTMAEAEPYMGTETGLRYILQRIFKADVDIHTGNYQLTNCTNGPGITNYNLFTNDPLGSASIIEIKLYFDETNPWLSNMKTTDSIMYIIMNYCAMRTRFGMLFNVIIEEVFDRGKMSDYYLFDRIIETSDVSYGGVKDEMYHDKVKLTDGVDVYEKVVEENYHDTLREHNLTDAYTKTILDGQLDVVHDDLGESEYEKDIIDESFDATKADDGFDNYKFGNIIQYKGHDEEGFGFVGNESLVSDSLVTNANGYLINGNDTREEYFDRLTDVDNLQYKGATEDEKLFESITEIRPEMSSFYELTLLNGMGLISNDFMTNSNQSHVEDELLDTEKTEIVHEVSLAIRHGLTNAMDTLISTSFSTNAGNAKDEMSSKGISKEEDHYNIFVQEEESTNIYHMRKEELTLLNGLGILSHNLVTGTNERKDEEIVQGYFDDVITNILRSRPVSYICSECVLSGNFYTTDISY